MKKLILPSMASIIESCIAYPAGLDLSNVIYPAPLSCLQSVNVIDSPAASLNILTPLSTFSVCPLRHIAEPDASGILLVISTFVASTKYLYPALIFLKISFSLRTCMKFTTSSCTEPSI